jgi:hypothetical protein
MLLRGAGSVAYRLPSRFVSDGGKQERRSALPGAVQAFHRVE